MTFPEIENALVAITGKTYRTFSPEGIEPPYIVWDDDGQSDSLHGDDEMVSQEIEGTIDLFTTIEDDPMFDQIQGALNTAGIGFRYNSKQHEKMTGIYHYEWIWQAVKEL